MLTLYFCLDEHAPVLRLWPASPRVGDRVALPEFGGNVNPLKVYDVVWEGFDEPSISVYLHPARIDDASRYSSDESRQENEFS